MNGPQEQPLEISCEELRARRDAGTSPFLLDCREQDEYERVRLSGATLLPMSELADRVGELDARQSDEIVVYCHHGGRSLRVAMWLRSRGFPRASSLSGGIDRWALEIDPTLPRY
jgi:rhodanese-related sulfurtransferase